MHRLIDGLPLWAIWTMIGGVVITAIYAIRRGYLHVHVKGIDISRPSVGNEPKKGTPPLEQDRAKLMAMVNFTEDLMDWGQQEITNRIRNMYGGEVNFLVVRLVCEKVYDRCLTWIILNHIEDTSEYVTRKVEECYKALIAVLGGYVPDRVRTKEYQTMLRAISEEFVREFVRGICSIKERSNTDE